MSSPPVLGVDPGTRKCGFAVLRAPGEAALEQGIVPLEELAGTVAGVRSRYGVQLAALGAGTHCATIEALLLEAGLRVVRVDERDTTLRARTRYFQANPPRGWRRLVPRGMLLPPRPVDDFAAVLIAERFLEVAAQPPELRRLDRPEAGGVPKSRK